MRIDAPFDVRCSPEEAFDFVADPANMPLFQGFGPVPGIARAEVDDVLGPGVTCMQEALRAR